jgi:hypothetical protein
VIAELETLLVLFEMTNREGKVHRVCVTRMSNPSALGQHPQYDELRRPCRSSAVRRWLPTAAARVCVRAACGVCGGKSGTGAGFLRVLRFPLPIIPPISPLS